MRKEKQMKILFIALVFSSVTVLGSQPKVIDVSDLFSLKIMAKEEEKNKEKQEISSAEESVKSFFFLPQVLSHEAFDKQKPSEIKEVLENENIVELPVSILEKEEEIKKLPLDEVSAVSSPFLVKTEPKELSKESNEENAAQKTNSTLFVKVKSEEKLAEQKLNSSFLVKAKPVQNKSLEKENHSDDKVVPLHPHLKSTSKEEIEKNGYTVNFEDISIIELLHFVSKISGTNFVFDSRELQFNVTIVSQDPTSVDDLAAILLQVLKMHDLKVVEQGNNVLIYRNPNISKLSTVVTDFSKRETTDAVVVTRVFKLYTLSPDSAVNIIKPLLSHDAIISSSDSTQHIVVSDIAGNVDKVADLLSALDSPGTALDMVEYQVKHANPESLVSYVQEVIGTFSNDGIFNIFAESSTNKIFIVSSPRLTSRALQLLQSLDFPEIAKAIAEPVATKQKGVKFFMYKLKYQNGAEIAKSLQDIGDNLFITSSIDEDFINMLNSIQWLEANNSIVVMGSAANIEKLSVLLENLDIPPKQVYIEVLILETTLENSWDFGVQWVALGEDQSKLAYASGLLNNSPPGAGIKTPVNNVGGSIPPAAPMPGNIPLPSPSNLFGFSDLANASTAFGMGIIGNVLSHKGKSFLTLGGLLSALDQDGDTVIVLNPRIMAQDTQKANFFVGQNIPYQTTSTVIQETGSVTQNIEYEDVGVNLTVTSTIAPNNVVSLQIEQTISDLHSGAGTLTPTTNKTFSSTRLQVPDSCFLVMSGHIRDKTTKIRSGVPILGSLPILRSIFSRTIDQRQKRNIMMFIKPKVIYSFDQGVELSNKEGYRYNWESDKASMECAPKIAPECQKKPVISDVKTSTTIIDLDAKPEESCLPKECLPKELKACEEKVKSYFSD